MTEKNLNNVVPKGTVKSEPLVENKNLIKKYQRTQRLIRRRPILSAIVKQFGRDKAAAVCKLEDVDWLHWYYWEIPSKQKEEIYDHRKNCVNEAVQREECDLSCQLYPCFLRKSEQVIKKWLHEKRKKWNENKLRLSITEYFVPRVNTISMAEQQRFNALAIKSHPLLPEEYVVIRT